jgi:hypothetical protein
MYWDRPLTVMSLKLGGLSREVVCVHYHSPRTIVGWGHEDLRGHEIPWATLSLRRSARCRAFSCGCEAYWGED